jgi:hypothetical protein
VLLELDVGIPGFVSGPFERFGLQKTKDLGCVFSLRLPLFDHDLEGDCEAFELPKTLAVNPII